MQMNKEEVKSRVNLLISAYAEQIGKLPPEQTYHVALQLGFLRLSAEQLKTLLRHVSTTVDSYAEHFNLQSKIDVSPVNTLEEQFAKSIQDAVRSKVQLREVPSEQASTEAEDSQKIAG